MDVQRLVEGAAEDPEATITACADLMSSVAMGGASADGAAVLRARAVAERALGRLNDSASSARQAIAVADEVGDDEQAGLAWGTLGATLLYQGETELAEHALLTGRSLVGEVEAVVLDLQLAGLHARVGNVERSLALFADVIRAGRRLGDDSLVADALANRGTLMAYSERLTEADADLTAARELFLQRDQPVAAAQMAHNLGWVAGLRGDPLRSLELFGEASEQLSGFDFWEDTVRLADRAEALLHAGLFTEASADAAEAARRFARHGSSTDEAEAWLVCAHGALARGGGDAGDAAGRALALFEQQGRAGWAAEARLLVARWGGVDDSATLLEFAAELDAAGQGRMAMTSRLLAARSGDSDALAIEGDLDELPLAQAVLFDTVRCEELVQLGRGGDAVELVRDRLGATADVRAAIGACDVRAGLSAVLAELRDLGLSICDREGDVAGVFEFAEWGSLALVEPPLLRESADPELADGRQELRLLSARLRSAEREFADVGSLPMELRRAERRVAELERRAARTTPGFPVTPADPVEIFGALGSAVLCRFVDSGDRLVRVDVAGLSGEMTRTDLGPLAAIYDAVNAVTSALMRELRDLGAGRPRGVHQERTDRLLDSLDRALMAGIDADRVIVVPSGAVGAVPWSLLPSRERRLTTVLPAASMLSRNAGGAATAARLGGAARIVAAAGPGLAHAVGEVRSVGSRYRNRVVLLDEQATVDATLTSMVNADVVHLATHGIIVRDQPMLSSFELADGRLTVYDLHSLTPPPSVVILASCESGREMATDGGESLGAASTLLGAGTSHVVGCPVALPDDPDTTTVMVEIHDGLLTGLEAPDALRGAVARLSGRAARIAGSLVVYGKLPAG